MSEDESRFGQGQLCSGKYYLTIKYHKRYGLWDEHVCPPRQQIHHWSSWTVSKCCVLDDCPVESGCSVDSMDTAMRYATRHKRVIGPNVVLVE